MRVFPALVSPGQHKSNVCCHEPRIMLCVIHRADRQTGRGILGPFRTATGYCQRECAEHGQQKFAQSVSNSRGGFLRRKGLCAGGVGIDDVLLFREPERPDYTQLICAAHRTGIRADTSRTTVAGIVQPGRPMAGAGSDT